MEYSIAHAGRMNLIGTGMWPDGLVPWMDAAPPDIEKGIKFWTGRLRCCSYCGSMHPTDVVAAIKAGATGEIADMKYGWPHKIYFDSIPNPHKGLLEVRSSATFKPEGKDDWVKTPDLGWREPGTPAAEKIFWKFYTLHLQDATPEEREVIEEHIGLHFEFEPEGGVRWSKFEKKGG